MKRQQSSSVVFLTELLLALTIFALCSSVCARMFAASHQLSERSSALSQAVISTQSAIEAFKKYASPEEIARLLKGEGADESCFIYYDEDWVATGRSGAAYTMEIQIRPGDGMRYATIVTTDRGGAQVYSLDVSALPVEGLS
ncbi:MAG: hypothetical protein FWF83_08880 [Clostridiales bacterium]|nr:hypothetical protein [Clostridiales bacterium]